MVLQGIGLYLMVIDKAVGNNLYPPLEHLLIPQPPADIREGDGGEEDVPLLQILAQGAIVRGTCGMDSVCTTQSRGSRRSISSSVRLRSIRLEGGVQ
jgi:hypothetical protein